MDLHSIRHDHTSRPDKGRTLGSARTPHSMTIIACLLEKVNGRRTCSQQVPSLKWQGDSTRPLHTVHGDSQEQGTRCWLASTVSSAALCG
jgi:hypothetical protein